MQLALKKFQPALKVAQNIITGTVAEGTGQTQPGRRQVLRFDGAEKDSCRRLNAPLDNTSGRACRPRLRVWVMQSSLWQALSEHNGTPALEAGLGGRAGRLQHMHHPNVEYVPQTGKLVST